MKPKRFSEGQAVTPNKKEWGPVEGYEISPPPIFGKEYHVSSYYDFENDHWYIFLDEMPSNCVFNEEGFDPVDLTTEQVSEVVEESLSMPVELRQVD